MNLTPEEREQHDRNLARKRKQKQRENEERLRIVVMTPELEEFVDELLSLRLRVASMALAIWQKENRQKFPLLEKPEYRPSEEQLAFAARWKRWQRFQLIRMFATDAIEREKGRDRKKRFDDSETKKAAELGVTVDAFRKHKRGQKLAEQMAQIAANHRAA
ncbi:hypothetical protein [Sinorhizobium meliloti]|uniref:hypothetical protein n=1 Tax=Rhizobium meliloti TaxID=382 RepID=UPI000FD7D52C|nr:hypothetical protein [Sinorhizobium meliloti]RVI38014.1 hypothetical protein CN195_34945 [Sinorhizobium meliloti]